MTLSAALATPGPFRAWLESKGPEETVGQPRKCRLCPISEFLLSLGFVDPSISELFRTNRRTGQFGVHAGEHEKLDLPKWAEDFIDAVDLGLPEPVTALECLALLPSEAPSA